MQELLKRGIGVHHSGILPILKEVRNGLVYWNQIYYPFPKWLRKHFFLLELFCTILLATEFSRDVTHRNKTTELIKTTCPHDAELWPEVQ